jgi:cell division septum initiation protein DivIVA
MKRIIAILIIALSKGAVGCAQQSAVHDLEQRITELESDLKTVAVALDESENALAAATKTIDDASENAVESIHSAATGAIAQLNDASDQAVTSFLALYRPSLRQAETSETCRTTSTTHKMNSGKLAFGLET